MVIYQFTLSFLVVKNVDSRVLTRMLHGKNLTQWPWPMTLKFGQNPLKDVDSRVFTRMLRCKNLTRWPLTYDLAQYWHYYPLANEVAKGYSNATIRPSFHSILVTTLESTSFNGFWPNLVQT
jgi:hypothetical protein